MNSSYLVDWQIWSPGKLVWRKWSLFWVPWKTRKVKTLFSPMNCLCLHNGITFELVALIMRLNLSYEDWIFRSVPGKCPPPNFDSFVVFEVFHETAPHAKSWCNESEGRSAVIVLRHFWGHDIRFTHTCPWPCLQHSSPAARNLHIASNDWMLWKLGNEATSWSALQHVTAFSTVGLASTKHERSDNASRFGTPWQLTL